MALGRRLSKSVYLGLFCLLTASIVFLGHKRHKLSDCSRSSIQVAEWEAILEGYEKACNSSVQHKDGRRQYQLGDVVFVTAASQNHYHEMIDAIASVQTYFPSNRILFYDLGISSAKARNVNRMCSVEYRIFPFDRYPDHVRVLKIYAWKALLLNELVDEFEAVFWFDASIRFKSNGIQEVLKKASQNGGVSSMLYPGHSIFAATHEATYNYLPLNLTKAKTTYMIGAGLLYFQRTPFVRNVILPQWSACALQRCCIAPIDTIACNFEDKGEMEYFANCHRFEQAALSIILARHFHYNLDAYYVSYYDFASVKRSVTNLFNISYCSQNHVKWTVISNTYF